MNVVGAHCCIEGDVVEEESEDDAQDEDHQESLLKNRPFQAVMTAYTFSSICVAAAEFALPILYLRLSGSVGRTATIATVEAFASLLALSVAGGVVDKLHKVWVMRGAQCFEFLFAVALFTVVQWHATQLWIWLTVAALQACAGSFSSNAESASAKSLVTSSQLYKAMNVRQGRAFAATLIGPAMGGVLIQYVDPALVFLVAAAGNAAALIILFVLLRVSDIPLAQQSIEQSKTEEQESGLLFALDGVRRLFFDPVIRAIALNLSAVTLAGGMLLPAITYGFTQEGIPATAVSLATILGGIGGLAGIFFIAPFVDKRQLRVGNVAITALIADALFIVGAAALNSWIAYVIAIGVMSALVPLAVNGIYGFLSMYAPSSLQGRTFAAIGLSTGVVGAITPGLVGIFLSKAGGLQGTMMIVGVIYGVAALTILGNTVIRRIPASKSWSRYITTLSASHTSHHCPAQEVTSNSQKPS